MLEYRPAEEANIIELVAMLVATAATLVVVAAVNVVIIVALKKVIGEITKKGE